MANRPIEVSDDGFSDDEKPSEAGAIEQQPVQQSVVLAVLIFLTVATLVIGGVTTFSSVRAPFTQSPQTGNEQKQTEEVSVAKEADLLRTVDTDSDTLNDYDELNVYHTSPYLKDTDSDGYDDKQELETGHDPLCATGKECGGERIDGQERVLQALPSAGAEKDTRINGPMPQEIFSQLEAFTPDQVRDLLRKQGLPEAQIQSLDDVALMKFYATALTQLKEKSPASGGAAAPTFDLSKLSDPQNPRSDEIRALLKGKIPDEELQKIDDATLKRLFDESLKQQSPQQ